jgi:hypothetical protein
MRSHSLLLTLSICLSITVGCTSKPSATNPPASGSGTTAGTGTDSTPATTAAGNSAAAPITAPPAKKEPLVVPSGTTLVVSLGSTLGSKASQPGQAFGGTIAKDVMVAGAVAVPKGAAISGTVTDAKPLGKFAGGAVLQVRLDSVTLNGVNLPVHAALRTFNVKGKGKRTGVMTGGGAALGGIIGAIAGGGKGAAIGMAAGGGAGAGGAALTGNNDIVLAIESNVSFQLSQSLEIAP